jgi:hypothetical protein
MGVVYRAVLLTIVALFLLLVDAAAVYATATGGSLFLALLVGIPGLAIIVAMLLVRFDARRRSKRRWPHRGATRDEYNPWIGGGLGPRR